MKRAIFCTYFSVLFILLSASSLLAKKEEPPIAAEVGGQKMTMAELDEASKSDLMPLASQIYAIKKRKLDEIIENTLIELGAKDQKKSVEDFKKELNNSSASSVSDDAIEVYYDANQAKFQGKPLAEVKEQIRQMLVQTKSAKEKAKVMDEIKQKHPVEIFLEEPKVEINISGAPFRGPENAKVTVVEFSDFECPFCAKFKDTIDQLNKEYPSEVKHVFRNNPLPFHKSARPAAKAGICSHKQGKFWAMRDQLFSNQKSMDDASIQKYAETVGLKMDAFNACMKDPQLDKQIDDDIAYAQSVGARGTPTSFINGTLFSGAQPYPALKQVVDQKLGK